MSLSRRVAHLSLWLTLAVVLSVCYGVINDQLTVTLSPEYFSVFKRRQFAFLLETFSLDAAPTRVQAAAVGAAATWWFGGLLGFTLGAFALSRCSTLDFLRLVLRVLAAAAIFSVAAGFAAFLLWPLVRPTPADWPFLSGIADARKAWAVGWWHNGAYSGAVFGTLAACRRAWKIKPDNGTENGTSAAA